jgi:hypothetical protein
MVNKSIDKVKKRDTIAVKVADMYGVSPDYVRKIRRGDRDNEDIFATIMDLVEGETRLIQEVKRRVPFDQKAKKGQKTSIKDLNDAENTTEKRANSHFETDNEL